MLSHCIHALIRHVIPIGSFLAFNFLLIYINIYFIITSSACIAFARRVSFYFYSFYLPKFNETMMTFHLTQDALLIPQVVAC